MPKDLIMAAADIMAADNKEPRVFVGFDGFLDTILHVVDERIDQNTYRRLDSMENYAERIRAAAGYSANIELVPQTVKLGGNGPIMADGLLSMGCRTSYAGALGAPQIHFVFAEFVAACDRVISIADPATTDAIEFVDGKLLMGRMDNLAEINWDNLSRHIPEAELLDLLKESDLIAAVNWTMLPAMNSILSGMQTALEKAQRRPLFFIDLADPRKRLSEDIRTVLNLLSSLQQQADVVLGMNEQESAQVEQVLLGETDMDLRNRAIRIRSTLGIHQAVIHPLRSACVADGNEVYLFDGPFTPCPKLTTGAGDTFNAGYCRGLLAGLTPDQSLGSGVCASGFYVRNARPPSVQELAEFMQEWAAAGCCSEFE